MLQPCVVLLTVALMLVAAVSPAQARDKGSHDSQATEPDHHTMETDWDIRSAECWPAFNGVQRTDAVEASFDCFGHFGSGYNVVGPKPGASFMSPPESDVEYLWGGAIWVGGVVCDDTLVSVGADGWQQVYEMYPPNHPVGGSVTEFDYVADHSFRAQYSDTITEGIPPDYFGRPHTPLPIEIAMRSHVWNSEALDEIIVYDMVITNTGPYPIEQGYIGFYFDADVCYDCEGTLGYFDDITGWKGDAGIAYIIDNDGDLLEPVPAPKILAFKLLHTSFNAVDTNFNWWLSNGNSAFDFGPRQKGTPENPFRDFGTGGGIGTPEGDANKYYVMSFPEWDYDQIFTASIQPNDPIWLYPDQNLDTDWSNGFDTRFLVSYGPLELSPGESERILFTTFTADSVHVDPYNLSNLPDDPSKYYDNLNFTKVLQNATWAESFVDSLLNPENPVMGLHVSHVSDTSVQVRWDPWALDDIAGYEVYLSEVPPDSLPYPGVAAPWLRPDHFNLFASLDWQQRSYTFDALDPHKIYFVNVANRTATDVGDAGAPVFAKLGDRLPAPTCSCEFLFIHEGETATLEWEEPVGVEVDHYNVYRVEPADLPARWYHPFYDQGCMAVWISPKDSFYIPDLDRTYYYYARDPYVQIDSQFTEMVDISPIDEAAYRVTAVDKYGFETHFSDEVTLYVVEPRTKHILVLTNSPVPHFVRFDTVQSFYDAVLSGYDYDIYNISDTAVLYGYEPGCVDWRDFTRYELVIVDDGLRDEALGAWHDQDLVGGMTRLILSGGKLAYFGSFTDLQNFTVFETLPDYYSSGGVPFIERFFAIDSTFYAAMAYCYEETGTLPCSDDVTGLSWAEATVPDMPDVAYDLGRYTFTSQVSVLWPSTSPPLVSTFKVTDRGEVTHYCRTLYPGVSLIENEAIGLKTTTDEAETYLFGFHLWYMDVPQSQALIESIIPRPIVAATTISPDTIYAFYATAVSPSPAIIYVGDFTCNYTAGDIDLSSILVNETVAPQSCQVSPSHPGFDGEVLECVMDMRTFIDSYGPLWGTSTETYTVTGRLVDDSVFSAVGELVIIGHRPGDLTNDGVVDISDLVYLVEYMFAGGQPPKVWETADVDGDCKVDIADLTHMASYLFGGGAAPRPGCSGAG